MATALILNTVRIRAVDSMLSVQEIYYCKNMVNNYLHFCF